MGVFPFRTRRSGSSGALYELLDKSQNGDQAARNQLIETYTPFVLRITSQAARRYIEIGRDEEFSIALMGFNEAISHFDASRNSNFLGFAETIIRRRLIDYFRSQKSSAASVSWSQFDVVDDEDNVINYAEVTSSTAAFAAQEEQSNRRLEIEMYSEQLETFSISFEDLVEISPKHADARDNALSVARLVVADPELKQYLFDKRALPLKQLEGRVAVSRKTIERQRKYIIALVVLLDGDYPYLQAYLK